MPGQDLTTALIKTHKYEDTIEAYRAVVAGTAEDTAALPGAANAAGFLGFTLYAGTGGDDAMPIHMTGGIAKATAKSAFSAGALLRIADTTGKVEAVSAPTLTQIDSALVPSSHQATLTKTAVALIAVKVNAATGATGPYDILPKGATPAAGQCALNSSNKVVFYATDAVTSVDVEYFIAATPSYVVAKALRAAAADGDIVPVLPLHQTSQG